MSYQVGEKYVGHLFLVRSVRKFDWGVVGTLYEADNGDVAFKFGNEGLPIDDELSDGKIIKVNGYVSEYNGSPQVQGKCDTVDPTPDVLDCVLPTASIDVQAVWSDMLGRAHDIKNEHLRVITTCLLHTHAEQLRRLPGGRAMHHAYIGGWLEHTYGIMRMALASAEIYADKLSKDLLVAGAILHDIGKILEFRLNELGLVAEYTFLGDGLGHAALGAGMIMQVAQEQGYDISDPDISALINTVGTHAGRPEWGAPAEPCCMEAFVISNLDNLDAHVNSVWTVVQDQAPGMGVYDKSTRHSVYRAIA